MELNHSEERYTFLDFFAGSGLVSEGMSNHFQAVWANDICSRKAEVYQANHPDHTFNPNSIEDVSGKEIPKAMMAWASFPCQDLSLAGKLIGISGQRSGLVWMWLRVLDEMTERPPLLVAENVVGLVSANGGEYYRALHTTLEEKGYRVGAMVLDAARWIPQSRPRVFVVAVDKHIDIDGLVSTEPTWLHPKSVRCAMQGLDNPTWWIIPEPPHRKMQLADIVDFDAPCDEPRKSKRNVSLIPESHFRKLEANKSKLRVAPGYKRTRNGKQVLELRFDGIAGCLRTPKGGSSRQYLVIPRENGIETRLLTVRETARLMGAPEHYLVPGATDKYSLEGSYNDGYQAMGDAVAVPVAEYLSEHLLAPLACRISQSKIVQKAS